MSTKRDAAGLQPQQSVTTSFAAIGQPVPQEEGPEKVSGRALYAADLLLPGMLWGKVLRSPYPHAHILSIDTAKARTVPGVHAVLTSEDAPDRLFSTARHEKAWMDADDTRVLDPIVRFIGQEEGHRVARQDLPKQHPDERAHVGELRVAAKRARQTRDCQQPIVQPTIRYVHATVPHEEKNRGPTRTAGEGILTGDRALVKSIREYPRKIVLF